MNILIPYESVYFILHVITKAMIKTNASNNLMNNNA